MCDYEFDSRNISQVLTPTPIVYTRCKATRAGTSSKRSIEIHLIREGWKVKLGSVSGGGGEWEAGGEVGGSDRDVIECGEMSGLGG
jgi:hypothetical protein